MAQSVDHPQLEYIQAAGYTVGRGGFAPIWIVVHDMEAGEDSGRAESTARYFANPGDGRNVSSHYCVDDDSVIQCVRLKDTAWTVGNTPGNQRGINWELSGFARQTRAEWLDAFGINMFKQMAPIVQADAREYGIPLKKLTIAELRAFKPGVTSHNDLREAFNVTTHTDPGPAFPWDVFLSMMQGSPAGGDDVGFLFRVDDDPDNRLWASDGLRRRLVRGTPSGGSPIGGSLERAGFVNLGTLASGVDSWDAYATKVGGPEDPGELAGEGGGSAPPCDCPTTDQIRNLVRTELDNTKLGNLGSP
jgi:N-acetyl-anhydromuramyl-L-alanine amidase AmpD